MSTPDKLSNIKSSMSRISEKNIVLKKVLENRGVISSSSSGGSSSSSKTSSGGTTTRLPYMGSGSTGGIVTSPVKSEGVAPIPKTTAALNTDYSKGSGLVGKILSKPEPAPPTPFNFQTQAYIQHGYKPNDPDYQTIYSDITSKQKDISTSRKQIPSSIISVIRSEPGTTFTFDDTGKEYTKKETLGKLTSNLFGSMKTSAQLRSYKKNIEKYEAGGYNIDLTDTGVSFSEPSVEEVFKWRYGDSAFGTSRLVAGSAMELGIPALFSGAASLVTRDSKYWENEVNRQREKALNLSIHKGETGTDVLKYAGRFWTSPESVESFYLPVATLGVGYVYTGVKAGATGAVTTGRLAITGAKHGSKIIKTMDKVLLGAGIVGSATSGASIGSSFAYEHAGMLPRGSGITAVGKTATGWTLAAGGFMTGQSMYMSKYTAPVSSTPKINTKDIYTISTKEILTENIPGGKYPETIFVGRKTDPFVQFSKQGTIKGTGQLTGISLKSDTGASISKGLLTVRSSWSSRFGTKFSNTKFIDVEPAISIPRGKPIGGYQEYLDIAMFTDRGTGLKTYSYGRSIVGATGKNVTFRTPVYSTKNLTLYDNPIKFSEYESLSLGKFRVGGKDIGMGMDYSKIYLKDITGSFGGGNSGRGIVIGGGSAITGRGTIGTLYGGGVKLGSVTSTIPASMRSSPVTGFVSGGSASGVTSSISIPSYAGGGLVSIPKTVSVSNSKYIQSPKLSSIISPVVVSVPKIDTIQAPVTIQDYRKMNTLDGFTIPMSAYEFKTSTLQSPSQIVQPRVDYKRANLLDTVNLGMLNIELKTITPVTPVMVSKIVNPVVPRFWYPPLLELGGGGGIPSRRRYAKSRYKFREFNIPSLDKLFKIKGGKKKYGI